MKRSLLESAVKEVMKEMHPTFSDKLDPLFKKVQAAREKQIENPAQAAKTLVYNIHRNIASEQDLKHSNWTDGLNSKSQEVVDRLKKALEGKFKYYGSLVDIDYAGLNNALASATYQGTAVVPDEDISRFFEKKLEEETTFVDTRGGETKAVDIDPKAAQDLKKDPNITGIETAKGKKIKEDHHHNPNDDSDMAKIQLLQVADYAQKLLEMIDDGQELDAWIQAKITKVADYIGTVKHYLEGEEYLDHHYEKGHPAHGDEEFYNEISEEYKAMYESWMSNLINRKNKFVGKTLNFRGHEYEVLDIDDAGTVTLIDPSDPSSKAFYVNRAQLKQGLVEPEEEAEEIELNIEPEIREGKATCCGRCGQIHEKKGKCTRKVLPAADKCKL